MDLEEELWCRPVKEICDELGVSEGPPLLFRKAAFGLVAPLHWYYSISNFLEELGYRRLQTEPYCWVYVDEHQEVPSFIHGHVDDFLFGGREGDVLHDQLMKRIQQKFTWGNWEYSEFIQRGIHVQQAADCGM